MRCKIFLPLFVALLCFAIPASVLADTPAPAHDYTQVTRDGHYIFVMLAREGYSSRGVLIDDELRKKYAQSGLYKNDGSTSPLWTVDWYASDVEVSSDGQHVVRYGPWPLKGDYTELALAFHKNGKELSSYSVGQLVMDPSRLPHTVSHYWWLSYPMFDEEAGRFSVETKNGEKHELDVATGRIISSTIPTAGPAQPVPTMPADLWLTSDRTSTAAASPTQIASNTNSGPGEFLISGVVSLTLLLAVFAGVGLLRVRKQPRA